MLHYFKITLSSSKKEKPALGLSQIKGPIKRGNKTIKLHVLFHLSPELLFFFSFLLKRCSD